MYDQFAVETAIMKICNTLMYRLLDGGLESRTVCLKIRYEDFSTESARETSEHPVSTMNDLFDRLCSLFHRKYKRDRGIRLIGAGLINLEDSKCSSGELFEFEDERKIKLEKCIHEINKKFPSSAIKKARLI
jgi:DNA polymerase-4